MEQLGSDRAGKHGENELITRSRERKKLPLWIFVARRFSFPRDKWFILMLPISKCPNYVNFPCLPGESKEFPPAHSTLQVFQRLSGNLILSLTTNLSKLLRRSPFVTFHCFCFCPRSYLRFSTSKSMTLLQFLVPLPRLLALLHCRHRRRLFLPRARKTFSLVFNRIQIKGKTHSVVSGFSSELFQLEINLKVHFALEHAEFPPVRAPLPFRVPGSQLAFNKI